MFTQFCGHYLIKKQLITEAQFAEILKAQRETRVKLGLIARLKAEQPHKAIQLIWILINQLVNIC